MSAIQHVGLEVAAADAPRELAFWRLLGFVEVAVPGGSAEASGARTRWVERGGTQVHLLLVEAGGAGAPAPVVPPAGHVALVCEDYAEVIAALRAAGHDAAPRTEYWGAPRTHVRSPGGHLVELMAAPPG